jgi:hypothetical protein
MKFKGAKRRPISGCTSVKRIRLGESQQKHKSIQR